ncbi:MAG: pilus assembly protein [Chloroflexi bacterium]|nr:pilus assembly protein [Chloroflexota bacterium]
MNAKRKVSMLQHDEQRGQSIVEVAFSLPFILLILLMIIEMGIVFSTYLGVVNAAREGAVFASMYPQLADASCASQPQPNCTGTNDGSSYGGNSVTLWEEYFNRVANESFVAVGEPMRAQQLIKSQTFLVERPIAPSATIGSGITVTVHYTLSSFSSGMSFPFFDRLGLPSVYHVHYAVAMPIR